MKVGEAYTTPAGEKFYWKCNNDGTNFQFTALGEDQTTLIGTEFINAPDHIKCWGDVAHLMGQETIVCKECGQRGELENRYDKDKLKENSLCSKCWFWTEKYLAARERFIDNKWQLYTTGPEPTEEQWKKHKAGLGFGGARYEFELHSDQSHVVSHNVWYGGEVPEHFRDRFPVNCTIIADTKEWWQY